MTLHELLSALIILLYALGTVTMIAGMLSRNERLKKAATLCTLGGFAAHTIALALVLPGQPIDSLGKSYYMQMLAWSMLLICFIVWWRLKLGFLAMTASPIALVLYLASYKIQGVKSDLPDALVGLFLSMHIGALFLSFALLGLAFGAGLIFLHLNRKIKTKEPLTGFRKDLPALSSFDRVNHIAVVSGFPLFSLGMLSGFVWGRLAWGKVITGDPKEFISIAMWIAYGILYHHRLVLGWQGRKPAIWVIWLFAISAFSLFGVNFFMNTHHSFIQR